MQLTPMRFTTIEGTEVTVKVNSPAEAKVAIKELKHRKKEYGLLRRGLVRQQKAALKERARVERADSRRARRWGLVGKAASLFRSDKPLRDLDAVEQELRIADEIMHNLDVCILQIEGKLLLHG